MKKTDVAVVLCIAVMTFCGTVILRGTLGVATANSVKQNEKAIPVLKNGKVECALALKRGDYKEGDKPVLLFTATNKGMNAEEIAATIQLMKMRAQSLLERSMPVPESIWTSPCRLSLSPKQTETIELTVSIPLEKGMTVELPTFV